MSQAVAEASQADLGNLPSSVPVGSVELDKGVTVGCIDSLEGIRALQASWEGLESRAAESFQYFQSYQWCMNWCQTFLAGAQSQKRFQIRIFTLEVDGQLAMVWPMMVHRSALGLRVLTALSDPLGQYGNVIVDRSLVDLALGKKFWNHVRESRGIDAIQISQFPEGSFLAEMIGGEGIAEQSDKYALYRDFTKFDAWEDIHASLSKNARRQSNSRRKKLEKEGELSYEVAVGGTEKYQAMVAYALELKKVWLKESGIHAAALKDEQTLTFLSGLSASETEAGAVPQGALAHVLKLDGKPIAIEVGMLLGSHYYSYLGAFDWQWRNYSPGKLQMEMTQKWAMDANIEKYDLMAESVDYKSQWTDSSEPLKSVSVPVSFAGLVYAAVWKARLRPALKSFMLKIGSDGRKAVLKLFEPLTKMSSAKQVGNDQKQEHK